MACFIVPAVEAVITTTVSHVLEKREKTMKRDVEENEIRDMDTGGSYHYPFYKKLGWLSKLLGGGSALLAFEHLWHGEITPWFPFLTNAVNPASRMEMFQEMATNGVAMAVLITLVWCGMVWLSAKIEKDIVEEKEERQV